MSALIINYLRSSYSFAVFQEPRGVMRVFQFIFSICAFYATSDFVATMTVACHEGTKLTTTNYNLDYPFEFAHNICPKASNKNETYLMSGDFSSDAQFFVLTGVLSMLYAVFIILVYVYLDSMYKAKPEFAMADFGITLVLAIFWLSGSAAWSNGTSAFKIVTDSDTLTKICYNCSVNTTDFSGLDIALVLGFLNFFLWGSDLWFVYKETIWFQARNMPIENA